jgi:hypothetical protein
MSGWFLYLERIALRDPVRVLARAKKKKELTNELRIIARIHQGIMPGCPQGTLSWSLHVPCNE